MVTQIVNGVYQLKVPIPNNPLENTNIYLVQGDKSYTLIDTGWDSETAFNSINRQLAEVGVGFRDISKIVITHAHFDHFGLAGKIQQQSGAKLYMHNLEQDVFHTRYTVTDDFLHQIAQWFAMNGVPAEMIEAVHRPISGFRKPIPAQPDVFLNGDEIIDSGAFNLKVIWTPGHSPGHICLYEPAKKILFSGDHVLPVITPNISLTPTTTGNPLGDFIKSLLTVKELAVDIVLPAHENIFRNLPQRVDEIIKHHEIRSEEILKAMNHQETTAFQIATEIKWMPELGGVSHDKLMPVAKLAAVSETLAHLKAMSVENKVTSVTHNDIVYYKDIC
jgi:glyoxylase-like metal-dependent hydrolase (beta-lactamase superfamily II)